jgi:hypothetical protein
VARSIGQRAAPCQKQNGTLAGVAWCLSGSALQHKHGAAAFQEPYRTARR